jgi:hypothetical protein
MSTDRVKLQYAIFSSPVLLLSKAEADGAELVRAVHDQDEDRARAALFNFSVTAYHIRDWVKAYRPDLEPSSSQLLEQHEALAACRDLANASKHAALDLSHRSYKNHPPVVDEVAMSAPVAHFGDESDARPSSGPTAVSPPWRFKVQLASGQRVPIDDLVTQALAAWRRYFESHSIT